MNTLSTGEAMEHQNQGVFGRFQKWFSGRHEETESSQHQLANEVLSFLEVNYEKENTYSAQQIYRAISNTKNQKSNKLWRYFLIAILTLLTALLIIFALSVYSYSMQESRDMNSPVVGDPSVPTDANAFVPLDALTDVPFERLLEMNYVTLRFPNTNSDSFTKYSFRIESVERVEPHKKDDPLILHLSSDHTLKVTSDEADLYRGENYFGKIIFPNKEKEKTEEVDVKQDIKKRIIPTMLQPNFQPFSLNSNTATDTDPHWRYLKGKNKHNYPAPHFINTGVMNPEEDFFDAYCRYGCGGMSVTFPYYYRPFFGYGFPLVGTEALFPSGYGGYPAAEVIREANMPAPTISTNSAPLIAGGFSM